MPERQTRSDGTTVDLPLAEAETYDTTAKAWKILHVNSAGTVIKVSQIEENKTGADCNGSDGATSRVLTLTNTSTSGTPVAVWVEGQLLNSTDTTFSHKAASSTVTFSKEVYNTDTIRIRYYI